MIRPKAADADISIQGTTTISSVNFDKAAQDSSIVVADGTTVGNILINAQNVKVIGWKKAASSADSSISQPPAKVEDHIAPAYKGYEITGEKTVRIDFSEPVSDGTNNTSINTANFKAVQLKPFFDKQSETISFSTDFIYTIQSADISGDSISLTFQEPLAEGKIKLTINALGTETADPIQDLAGNKASEQDITFNHTNDGSIISEATVKTATQTSVTLSFSKPVTAKNIVLIHGDKTDLANSSASVSVNDGDFADELTFGFTSEIPEGATSLFLVNSPEPDEKMFNIFGEYVPDQELAAVVPGDTEAPSVVTTELIDINTFVIHFNEKVSRSFAENTANYEFLTSNYYTTITFIPTLRSDGKSVELYIPKSLRDNTQYNVVIKNAEDLRGNKASDIHLTFTSGEYSAPSVVVDKCRAHNSDGKILIYFSEPMNQAYMLDKASYKVLTTPGAIQYVSLGTEDKISMLSDRSIMIDLNKEVDSPSVMIASLKDLSGKTLNNSAPVYLNNINAEAVLIESADLIEKTKLRLLSIPYCSTTISMTFLLLTLRQNYR